MPGHPDRLLIAALATVLAFAALLVTAGPAWPAAEGGAQGASARASWRWPLQGRVVGAFRYSAERPFEARARRGVDIAAAPGTAVRAACGGRVAFAGRVPRHGLAVSVRCGALTATHLRLAATTVRRGAAIPAGSPLGSLGPTGRLRLGARVTRDRFAYLDPLPLLEGDPVGAPLGRRPRVPLVPAPRTAPRAAHRLPVPAPVRALAGRPAQVGIPLPAWAGLVLLAAGLPLGGVVHRSRRRRRRAPVAQAVPPVPMRVR